MARHGCRTIRSASSGSRLDSSHSGAWPSTCCCHRPSRSHGGRRRACCSVVATLSHIGRGPSVVVVVQGQSPGKELRGAHERMDRLRRGVRVQTVRGGRVPPINCAGGGWGAHIIAVLEADCELEMEGDSLEVLMPAEGVRRRRRRAYRSPDLAAPSRRVGPPPVATPLLAILPSSPWRGTADQAGGSSASSLVGSARNFSMVSWRRW